MANSTASSASLPSFARIDPPDRRVVLTSILAGAVVCVTWTWRVVLRLPLGLMPDLQLPVTNAGPASTPHAPWWVPAAIVGTVAMLPWPILAAHARRMSLLGGSAAIVAVSILIFPIAAICVEVGGITHDGWPPIVEFVSAMPRGIGNALYCGLLTTPAAALIGLLLVACGRMMVWTVERFSGRAPTGG